MENSKNLYEQIYEGIKADILSGRLTHGQRLPSKRACAERYGVSVVTVENAYAQLIAEGYVRSAQRRGYFVQYSGGAVEAAPVQPPEPFPEEEQQAHTGGESFPFTVWARLMTHGKKDRTGCCRVRRPANGSPPSVPSVRAGNAFFARSNLLRSKESCGLFPSERWTMDIFTILARTTRACAACMWRPRQDRQLRCTTASI